MQINSHLSVLVHDLAKKWGEKTALTFRKFGRLYLLTDASVSRNSLPGKKKDDKMISTKNGQNLATVQLPEMHIYKTTVTPFPFSNRTIAISLPILPRVA